MSGIAGILNLDGRPVAAEDIAAMTATMAHRGPDGINHWLAGPVGLGHCMLRTTHQSLVESQPTRVEEGDLCLTMDGRVDNRDDLAAALGPDRALLRDASDAELVLRCYQRWGTACVVRIIGDFAFALWDGARQELICARDFLGKRPFYYSQVGSSIRFASEPQAVLVDPSVPRIPNKGMIAEYLSVRLTRTDETLFRDLLRLPAAHLMVVGPGGTRLSRYWDWDVGAEVRYRRDEDYAEHLLELCSTATEARLASPWPIAISLSGGLDSSSLVGVVMKLKREGRYHGTPEIFSMVYPRLECDESSHVRAVAAQHHLRVREVHPVAVDQEIYAAQVRQYLDTSDYPMTMAYRSYWRSATELGCRVMLTGGGPDEWLTGGYAALADHMRHGRFWRTAEEVRAGADGTGLRPLARHIWRYGVRPAVPPAVLARGRAIMGRTDCPDHLRASFCEAAGHGTRPLAPPRRGRSFAAAEVAEYLVDGWAAHANEFGERAAASVGLERRDPFNDRRVVEFSLAIPAEQRRRGQITKYVLRQAMTSLIPESVRTRADKADYSHVICEALRDQGGARLFHGTTLERRDWVDGARVRAKYDQLERSYSEGDPAYHRHMWSLWMLVSVDRWLGATV